MRRRVTQRCARVVYFPFSSPLESRCVYFKVSFGKCAGETNANAIAPCMSSVIIHVYLKGFDLRDCVRKLNLF